MDVFQIVGLLGWATNASVGIWNRYRTKSKLRLASDEAIHRASANLDGIDTCALHLLHQFRRRGHKKNFLSSNLLLTLKDQALIT